MQIYDHDHDPVGDIPRQMAAAAAQIALVYEQKLARAQEQEDKARALTDEVTAARDQATALRDQADALHQSMEALKRSMAVMREWSEFQRSRRRHDGA